ncbi:MAG: adenine phosphoribosyltransferase [Eubacterium sp.]|nr:adenine phosphoribosyltransferase [Eubacterium sp.]
MITPDLKRNENEYYELHIAGLTRQLQKFAVSDTLDIAAFILFGDVELVERCAEELLKKVPEFDYIVTPEAKSIPLAYEMSRQSGKKYIVARKGVKVYMDRPEKAEVRSITTQRVQTLYLGHEDGDLLTGKRVLVVDDVISTGESMKAVQLLVERFGANIVAFCAPLAEGDAADRDDIIFLEKLPLFFK